MPFFTFECECGDAFTKHFSLGGGPPGSVPCPGCGSPAPRVWTAPQVLVKDREVVYGGKDLLPHDKRLDPYGRNAEQIDRAHDKFIAAKQKVAAREKRARGTSKGKDQGMRYRGSVSFHDYVAYNRRANDKKAFLNDPLKALKSRNCLVD